MPTIVLEPELYKRVEAAAHEHSASVDAMLTEAVKRYLWDLDREKIAVESKIYQTRHEELKAQYLGQYIAIHDAEVVDHDVDFQALRQRVRERFGKTAVMMTRVEAEAPTTLVRRGFRFEATKI